MLNSENSTNKSTELLTNHNEVKNVEKSRDSACRNFDTNKAYNIDANKELTKSQQRANKELTPNKNDKELKNDKEKKNKPAALSYDDEYEGFDLWDEEGDE